MFLVGDLTDIATQSGTDHSAIASMPQTPTLLKVLCEIFFMAAIAFLFASISDMPPWVRIRKRAKVCMWERGAG